MEPKIIVMIVTLLTPSGDSGINVTPYETVDRCVVAAKHEAADPNVQRVECAELADGVLTLQFGTSARLSRTRTSG